LIDCVIELLSFAWKKEILSGQHCYWVLSETKHWFWRI